MQIELLPLGTCAANRTPYQTFSSYLLKIKIADTESDLLLDVGSSHTLNFTHYDPKNLAAIIISHTHIDHILHFGKLIQLIRKQHREEPLHIIADKQAISRLKWMIRTRNWGHIPPFIQFIPVNLHAESPITQVERIQLFEKAAVIQIQCGRAIHSKETLAYRIHIAESSTSNQNQIDFVYSPDTKFTSEHLIALAENADYWLLDSTFSTTQIDDPYQRKYFVRSHSSPRYSARLCERAHVKTYIIAHYFWERFAPRFEDVEQILIKDAQQEFRGNIIVAQDLKSIRL